MMFLSREDCKMMFLSREDCKLLSASSFYTMKIYIFYTKFYNNYYLPSIN